MRQHRYHTVNQIDAGRAAQRFLIECGVLADILGDIRDVNTQNIIVPVLFYGDRIINILRVRTVDRYYNLSPKVFASSGRRIVLVSR